MTTSDLNLVPHAAIVSASVYQFAAYERLKHPGFQSRLLLWAKHGRGELRLNRELYPVRTGEFLFVPWGTPLGCLAGPTEPFLIAGIALIPDYAQDEPVVYGPPPSAKGKHPRLRRIQDCFLPGLDRAYSGTFLDHPTLEHLAEYILSLFTRSQPAEWQARYLAKSLVFELVTCAQQRTLSGPSCPTSLKQMTQFVQDHYTEKIAIADLAVLAGMTESGLTRQFKRHFGCSPGRWITRFRMEQAKKLLASTSLAVGEVGRRVGVEDNYYFSKLFKKTVGMSARTYRNRTSLLY